jgi:hypothetical protein
MLTEILVDSPVPGQVAALASLQTLVSSTATSLVLVAPLPANLQTPGSQFHVQVDEEIMTIPCQPGTTLTGVTRGANPTAHIAGSGLFAVMTAGSLKAAVLNFTSPAVTVRPESFGAYGDGQFLSYAVMAAGSNVLNASDASFSQTTDPGKVIIVSGVGTGDDSMVGTILSVQSPTQATLSFNAVVASPDPAGVQVAVYGHDDTAAIQAASNAAAASQSGTVQFDDKVYVVSGALQTSGAGNSQLTLPNRNSSVVGAGTAGMQHLLWKGARAMTGSPNLPFAAASGTTIVSTLLGSTYSSTHGIPSIVGGPTQEAQSAFSVCCFDLEGIQLLASRNPSITALNCEGMFAHNKRGVMFGTLEWGYSQKGLEVLAIAEPTHPWAAAAIDPRTNNNNNSAGYNEQIHIHGYFAGIVPSEHAVYGTTRVTSTKIPLAVRSDANQRAQGFTHATKFTYLSVEVCPYFISGWNPTSTTSAGGVTSLTTIGNCSEPHLLVDCVDFEDFSDNFYASWNILVNHINDADNFFNGYVKFSRFTYVSGNFTKANALVLNGASQMVVTQNNPSNVGWQALTLSSGWSNYGNGYSLLAFRKDSVTNMVYLKGLVVSSSASPDQTIVCYLPAGCLPNENKIYPAPTGSTGQSAAVAIYRSTGGVQVAEGPTNTWVSFDGIAFLAEM